MSRRRPELPPAHRLAAVLGQPLPASDSGPASRPRSVGWVPTRAMLQSSAASTSAGGGRSSGRGWWLGGRRRQEATRSQDVPRRRSAGRHRGRAGRNGTGDDVKEGEPVRPPFLADDDGDHEGDDPRDRSSGPRLVTVPSTLAGARATPRAAAVVGLLIVLVVAAGFFAVRVIVARGMAQPRPVAAVAPNQGELDEPSRPAGFGTPTAGLDTRSNRSGAVSGPAGPTADASAASQGGQQPAPGVLPTAAAVLLVDVVGQVQHPGVVRLTAGARVQDAVAAAGGAAKHADLSAVNLARPVADGEQIVVPKPGEHPPAAAAAAAGGGAISGGAGTGTGSPGAAGPVALVNLNTADVTALDTLPGVGPVLSQRIIDWRTENGRFSSVDELAEVSGIGDKILAQLRPRVTV